MTRKTLTIVLVLAVAILTTLNSHSLTLASGHPVTRVYVAASGNDSNDCSFKLPCRGVNRARARFDRTTHSGTITIIESGNYPAFEIQELGRDAQGNWIHRAVTVEAAPGVMATISGGLQDAGIYIHVGSQDQVVLRNLHIDGASGNNGIDVKTGRWTYVESCSISDVNFGIDMRDSGELFVTDTSFKRTTIGVLASGYYDSAHGTWMDAPSVSIDNCHFELESTAAVKVADGAQAVIRNSVIAGTHGDGVWCTSDRPGVRTLLFVENSSITGSGFKCVGLCTGNAGIKAGDGTSSVEVTLSNNVITQNKVGVIVGQNGKVFSYGNNKINGNGTGQGDGTAPNDVQGALSLIKAR